LLVFWWFRYAMTTCPFGKVTTSGTSELTAGERVLKFDSGRNVTPPSVDRVYQTRDCAVKHAWIVPVELTSMSPTRELRMPPVSA